jgi:PAS domain-containing protein
LQNTPFTCVETICGHTNSCDRTTELTEPLQASAAWQKGCDDMHASADQLRMMIDTIPTLAWSCRPDGTTEFLNQRWLDYTGLPQEQALGWGWQAPIDPDDLGKLMDT